MTRRLLSGVVGLALVLTVGAVARAADKDDALAAVKKLADAPNYSWSTSQQGGRGGQEPVEFKTEKDGYTTFTVTGQDGANTDIVMKGGKAVAKTDGWKTTAELQKAADDAGGFSPELIVLIRVNNFAAPAAQAKEILEKAANVKKADDTYTADLTEAQAKDLLTFKMPAGMANGFPAMTVKDAKGTIKVWVKDGMLSKTEVHLTGTRTFNDQDNPVDQTTTATIKDAGTTKVTVADDAKKKLEQAATQPATKP
jgi:hypothetical protein